MKRIRSKSFVLLAVWMMIPLLFCTAGFGGQNVIIAVIDGLRYTEGFGAGNTYIPNMWDNMKPYGTIYTNFYKLGWTSTNPGHASIVTGTWQYIANDGSERPTMPTVFEYFRKETGSLESENYAVMGKAKLDAMTYSTHSEYGSSYKASSWANNSADSTVYNNLVSIMDSYHPRLIVLNLGDVDRAGHSGVWGDYISAVQQADSLVYELWLKIQSDDFYRDDTTLFVTNDHGRHDDEHGGFQSHGDSCEGCQHMMLLAVGKSVTPGQVVTEVRDQRDIAPTVGDLLNFSAPLVDGTSLFQRDTPLPITLSFFTATAADGEILLRWTTESETSNTGFNIYRSFSEDGDYTKLNRITIYGTGNSSVRHDYSFTDSNLAGGVTYWYKLEDVAFDGTTTMHGPVSSMVPVAGPFQNSAIPTEPGLTQSFPNPFNPATRIRYQLPENSHVELVVYDVLGLKVDVLVDDFVEAGYHSVVWDAKDMASGVYIIKMEAGDFIEVRKMTLIR